VIRFGRCWQMWLVMSLEGALGWKVRSCLNPLRPSPAARPVTANAGSLPALCLCIRPIPCPGSPFGTPIQETERTLQNITICRKSDHDYKFTTFSRILNTGDLLWWNHMLICPLKAEQIFPGSFGELHRESKNLRYTDNGIHVELSLAVSQLSILPRVTPSSLCLSLSASL
jgi:hypothetical protein